MDGQAGFGRLSQRVAEPWYEKKRPPKLGGFSFSELSKNPYGLVGSGAEPGFASCGVVALAATGLEASAP